MAREKKKESALTPEEKLAQALVPDWEQPYRVPDNWQYVFLNRATTRIKRGKAPKYVESSDYPVFAQKCNQKDGTICIEKAQFLNPALVDRFDDEEFLRDKDVVINSTGTGTLGRVGFYRSEYALPYKKVLPDSHITVVRPAKFVIPEYLYFFLKNAQDYLELQGVGSTNQKELRPETIGAQCFPFPPLAEQQRIVDRIEYLFAKLDEAKEKAQSVFDSFETRKAAILHKAFTGELTAKWRAERGISIETWKRSPLTDIATVVSGYAFSSKDFREGNTVPCIKITNVGVGEYVADDYEYLPDSYLEEYGRFAVNKGDILISLTRSFINAGLKVCICEEERISLLNQRVALIKNCNTGYIFYYLRSDEVLRYVKEKSKTTNQPNLSIKDLNNMLVAVPQWDEQNEIVRILDSLFAKEQQAKEAAEAVLEKIDLLKKSILARAFHGELGTNDPTEESALELLNQVLQEDIPAVTRKRSKSIPKDLQAKLGTELERKIVKLYFKQETDSLPVEELLSASSKKFEVMETLRDLEQRKLIKGLPNGNYRLLE